MYIEAGSGHVYGLSLPDLKIVWDFKTGSDLDSTAVATRDGFLLCGIEKQYIKGTRRRHQARPAQAARAGGRLVPAHGGPALR